MDKLSEWITQTIEQGNDRPIETQNLPKEKNSNQKTPQQNKGKASPKKPTLQKRHNPTGKPTGNPAHKPTHKPAHKPTGKPAHNRGHKPAHNRGNKPAHNRGNKPAHNRGNKPANRKPSGHKVHSKPPARKQVKQNQPLTKPFKGLRIIPIGGLNEVGKNLTVFEYNRTGQPKDKEIILIDMGFQFPEEDMLGVDYVIPDTAYLEENKKYIKAVLITHGHLDHTGGIPYILPKIDFPRVYATRLTRGLIEERIKEFKITKQTKISTINPAESLRLGSFKVDFFRVAHSIPDAVGIVIDTPEGKIVHSGDFKFDDSPAGIHPKADMKKLQQLGSQNVLALMSDSTNAQKPGHTMSESEVGRNLEDLIKQAKGRIIIASFSSLIGRIQQIFEYAERNNKKIYISGRSMQNNIKIALKLGFLKIKTSLINDVKKVNKAKDDEVIILTTGSQGEAVSALTRISFNDHAQIKIKKGDTVIVSASPIIGNEKSIFTVINNLCRLGARVIHNQIMDIHTSGHGYQEELSQMIRTVRPKYLIPIHGEYFMRFGHKELGIKAGIPENNCIIAQNGDVLDVSQRKVQLSNEKVPANYIIIDGLGEGTIGSQVIVDRQTMSLNGMLAIIIPINKKTKQLRDTPNVVSRGFMYMHEYDKITQELAELTGQAYKDFIKKRPNSSRKDVKQYIKGVAERYTRQKLERKPLILPLVFES